MYKCCRAGRAENFLLVIVKARQSAGKGRARKKCPVTASGFDHSSHPTLALQSLLAQYYTEKHISISFYLLEYSRIKKLDENRTL